MVQPSVMFHSFCPSETWLANAVQAGSERSKRGTFHYSYQSVRISDTLDRHADPQSPSSEQQRNDNKSKMTGQKRATAAGRETTRPDDDRNDQQLLDTCCTAPLRPTTIRLLLDLPCLRPARYLCVHMQHTGQEKEDGDGEEGSRIKYRLLLIYYIVGDDRIYTFAKHNFYVNENILNGRYQSNLISLVLPPFSLRPQKRRGLGGVALHLFIPV